MTDNAVYEPMVRQGFEKLKEGQYEEAIETFSAAHALDPRDDRPLRGRGLAYVQLHRANLSEADFRAARSINEKEPENWMGLGLSLVLQSKIYEAIAVYEELISLNPTHVAGHLQLGNLYLKIGTITKGTDYFKQALTLRPTMEQRRTIEAVLKEQKKLDAGRYYRPDFELLRKQQKSGPGILKFFRNLF